MRLADQLFAGEAADLDEGGIGIENPAFGVSARDEVLILTQLGFHIVDGKVHSHSQSPVASYGEERFHDGKHAGPRDAQACPRLVRESEMPSCTAFRRRNLFHRLSPGVTAINGYFFENLTCAESNYRHFPARKPGDPVPDMPFLPMRGITRPANATTAARPGPGRAAVVRAVATDAGTRWCCCCLSAAPGSGRHGRRAGAPAPR